MSEKSSTFAAYFCYVLKFIKKMRKHLYILTLLLGVLVGCNEESDTVTTSSETRVSAFTFYEDTANVGLTEVAYIVEHLSDTGRIYCKDSLRFGTRLDSVVPYITYKATPAMAKYFLFDTIVTSTGLDTLDFSKQPVYLYVQSSDLTQDRWYRIDITVHTADPELYIWKQLNSPFAPQNCDMKAFWVNDVIYLYVNNGFSTQVYQSKDGDAWTHLGAPSHLPLPCSVRDILYHDGMLYYVDGDKLYTTADMLQWTAIDFSDSAYSLESMLVAFHDKPWCILQDRDTHNLFLGVLQGDEILPMTDIYGLMNGVLPKDFPISDFAALSFASSSERPRAMIVGGRSMDGTPVNTRWNLEYEPAVGYRIVDFSIEQPSFNSLTGMSIIQYDNQLMMFGGIDNDLTYRSDILCSDDEGMNWYVPDTAHNCLPTTYQSRQRQTVVVDDAQNIYIIGGQTNTQSFSDVYCGYKNELKWDILND